MFFSKVKCPITVEDKEWVDQAFDLLIEIFGLDTLLSSKTAVLTREVLEELKSKEGIERFFRSSILDQMGIESDLIEFGFYSEQDRITFSEGLTTNFEPGTELTSGQYMQYNDGGIRILIEEKEIQNSVSLIATLAHEASHYKLLGEGNLEENDEYLTDLTAIFFGFGIFLANASIPRLQTWSGVTHSGWEVAGGSGYLHYKVVAYSLAFCTWYKNEDSASWELYLEKEALKVYRKSLKYISKTYSRPSNP